MVDAEYFKERQIWIDRYRALEREVTEPLAALLLHDIILDLETQVGGEREGQVTEPLAALLLHNIVLDLETQVGEERQSPTAPHPNAPKT